MKYIKLNPNRYFIRIDKDEEIMSSIADFCAKQKIVSADFNGIGATNNAVIGIYDEEIKEYRNNTVKSNCEITNLVGNVSLLDNKPFVHAHINMSDASLNTIGGHLKTAVVSVTCEIFLTSYKKKLVRQFDKQVKINTIKC
jgi:predicted DNA-binding protein with PD1-like motif